MLYIIGEFKFNNLSCSSQVHFTRRFGILFEDGDLDVGTSLHRTLFVHYLYYYNVALTLYLNILKSIKTLFLFHLVNKKKRVDRNVIKTSESKYLLKL